MKKKKVSFHLEIEIGLCNLLHNFRFAMELDKSIESNRTIEKSSNQLVVRPSSKVKILEDFFSLLELPVTTINLKKEKERER